MGNETFNFTKNNARIFALETDRHATTPIFEESILVVDTWCSLDHANTNASQKGTYTGQIEQNYLVFLDLSPLDYQSKILKIMDAPTLTAPSQKRL